MTWYRQAQAITWANIYPDLCHHMASLGYDDLIQIVVVILFPEEYNMTHSIRTTFQQFHKCIPLAVASEAQWLIELTTSYSRDL